ncbi:MAG: YdeI/OmpD-associated family protein [Acidimicrobiia bacterium]|nr:YdeI/OmpD-associated family protein [Acidimicrobiia bacterium]
MARRPVQPMPDDVRDALEQTGLTALYLERPFYQRNDYLAWIGRAKRPETRQKRLQQMLAELERGGVYMGMDHGPSRRD